MSLYLLPLLQLEFPVRRLMLLLLLLLLLPCLLLPTLQSLSWLLLLIPQRIVSRVRFC